MTQEHPITPPPELIRDWCASKIHARRKIPHHVHLAIQAARWGADQELEACCDYLTRCADWEPEDIQEMRDLRRPKPPSLKEQAKFAAAVLRSPDETCSIAEITQHWHTIRRALESLPD